MELTWPMRLRIAASVAVGVILIGILGWPFAAPAEPYGIVSLKNISPVGIIAVGALSVLAGLLGFSLSWPYGRAMGILSVPSGLAVWSIRGGSVANFIQVNGTVEQRLELFSYLKWEGFFWLAIVCAGFAGVLLGSRLTSKNGRQKRNDKKKPKQEGTYVNTSIAFICSILISAFLIMILAQDVKAFDNKLGKVVAQPTVGQIAFAVFVSFGAAGFAVKKFFNLSYIIPIFGTGTLTLFSFTFYAKGDIIRHLTLNWPASFFPNSLITILPLQMVSLGTLGSIWGYWLAVRYNYWRKHKI